MEPLINCCFRGSRSAFGVALSLLLISPGPLRAQETPSVAEPPAAETTAKPNATTTVTVTSQKKAVVKALDKTVYDESHNPRAATGSAYDVLQATPTVTVTPNGDISVKGERKVEVRVNGKPLAVLSGDDRAVALQTMAGSDIASIEVITNPSAAYGTNGGAILNIVLKKNRKPGAHGSIRASASDEGLWMTTLAGDVSKGKFSVHGSFSLRQDASLKIRQSDVDWHDPVTGKFGENLQSSRGLRKRATRNASFGADYDVTDHDTLSTQATYNYRNAHNVFTEFHQDLLQGELLDTYSRVSSGPNQQSDDSISLIYTHQGPDSAIKALLQRSDTYPLTDKSYENIFAFPVKSPNFEQIINRSARHLDQASLDWTLAATSFGRTSFGLDYQKDANAISDFLAAVDPQTGAVTVDLNTTHGYLALQTQKAAYLTWQGRWHNRWEALIGARFESLTTQLVTQGGAGVRGATYQSLDPSLHVKYSFSELKSLALSFRSGLQRPDPRDLDPYVTYGDAQNVSSGNPQLRPQGLNSVELGYDQDLDGLSQSLSVFLRRSTHTVVDDRSITPNQMILTSRRNAGSGRSTGASYSVEWTAVKGLSVKMDASLYRVDLETLDLNRAIRTTGMALDSNLSLDYSRGANDYSLDGHMAGTQITPEGYRTGGNSVNFTWRRHLSQHLDVTLNANDVLDGAKQNYRLNTLSFHQHGFDHFKTQRLYLGLVYRFG